MKYFFKKNFGNLPEVKGIMIRIWQSPFRQFFQEGWNATVFALNALMDSLALPTLVLWQFLKSIRCRYLN